MIRPLYTNSEYLREENINTYYAYQTAPNPSFFVFLQKSEYHGTCTVS